MAAAVTLQNLAADPHPILAALRAEAPVCWVPALDGWLVTSHPIAVQVMADPLTFTVDDPRFSTAQVIGASMLSTDGAAHRRHRTPFATAFRPAEVRRRFEAVVHAEAERLVRGLATQANPDLRRDLAAPLAGAVMAAALGLHEVDPAELLGWYRSIVAGVTAISSGAPRPEAAVAAFGHLRERIEATLRHGDPGSLLVAAAADGLHSDAVVSNAAVLLFGGIETTEAMIATAGYYLLADPALRDRVHHEPAALEAGITESLRLEPAAANVDRYATVVTTLAGAVIAAGDLVIVSLAAANRDPAVFRLPDDFDLDRPERDLQLAFARGPHFCLGEHLARAEAHAGLAALLRLCPQVIADARRRVAPSGLVFRKPGSVALDAQSLQTARSDGTADA